VVQTPLGGLWRLAIEIPNSSPRTSTKPVLACLWPDLYSADDSRNRQAITVLSLVVSGVLATRVKYSSTSGANWSM